MVIVSSGFEKIIVVYDCCVFYKTKMENLSQEVQSLGMSQAGSSQTLICCSTATHSAYASLKYLYLHVSEADHEPWPLGFSRTLSFTKYYGGLR